VPRRSRLRVALLLLGLSAAAAGGVFGLWTWLRPAPPPPSVAVLAFADMSPGHDQEYFADGIAEEILNALAQVQGLKVIGRTSSFSFKGKNEDLRTIGQKLDVGALLEGSVRKEGNRLRVTAQLVRTADGSHLWSQTFDRDQAGIFAVQEEIAREVVAALKVKLVPGHAPSTQWKRTANPVAYNQYLLGRHVWQRASPEGYRRALAAFEKALALDPGYAPAWAGASIVLWLLEETGSSDPELRRRAVAAADRAIALDPDLAEGYRARSLLRLVYSYDWAGAQADIERTLALSPGDTYAWSSYSALLRVLGRLPEALAASRKAIELDPLDAWSWDALGWNHHYSGQFDRARVALKRTLEISPEFDGALYGTCISLVAEGQAKEALASSSRLHDDTGRLICTALAEHDLGNVKASQAALDLLIANYAGNFAYNIGQVHAWRGQHDRAFEWLERAYQQRDTLLPTVKVDPLLRNLHDDPRWKPFLRKMNLPVD
jgi:TolB-like protein/tetratricopeptide (TPR) repeat protein